MDKEELKVEISYFIGGDEWTSTQWIVENFESQAKEIGVCITDLLDEMYAESRVTELKLLKKEVFYLYDT
jgi:hypothetical protein